MHQAVEFTDKGESATVFAVGRFMLHLLHNFMYRLCALHLCAYQLVMHQAVEFTDKGEPAAVFAVCRFMPHLLHNFMYRRPRIDWKK
jgi:hypothetical protein